MYQNHNIFGRFLRVETWLGVRKSAIIIPKPNHGVGWEEIAERICMYLGNREDTLIALTPLLKTFLEAANMQKWPHSAPTSLGEVDNHQLSMSLVSRSNDTFNLSPKIEIIHKWFNSIWEVTVGLTITPMNNNLFLFELPPKKETLRILVSDWFWNGQHLTLE